MKTIYSLLLLIFVSTTMLAQEESSWWIFGDQAGVEFTPNPQNRSLDPAVATSGYDTDEGVASISDDSGNLLFFTDGITVWNRNGNIMPNGTGLDGNFSSTQSAIIVKAPESPGVYFIFTVGAGGNGPLSYSRVEMSLNGGLGDVVAGVKNVVLIQSCAEKVAATIQTGSNNAYVMTFAESNATSTVNGTGNFNALFTWEVRGIPGPNVSFVFPNPVLQQGNGNLPYYSVPTASSSADRGQLRVSPDGTKLVICNQNSFNGFEGTVLYDFNPGNGQFGGNGLVLHNGPVYGAEFSPSSQYLYHDESITYGFNGNKKIFQYELCDANNILATKREIADVSEGRSTLQLARDGNIYVGRFDQTELGMIVGPETPTATYNANGFDISPGVSKQGLPVFVQSSFSSSFTLNDQCQGDATEFLLACLPQVAASTWDFGDGNTASVTGPVAVYNTYASAGTYVVSVNVTNVSGDTRNFTQEITIYENGIVDPIDTTLLNYCDDDASGSEIVDLSQFTADVLGSQDATTFDITYHANQTDADAGVNELPLNFDAPLGTTTIWVRIANNTSPIDDGCSAIDSFDLMVSPTPAINPIPDFETCDDNSQDGIEDFDLASYLPTIQSAVSTSFNVTITLHPTQMDADTGMNAIDTSVAYTNTTNPETIYVRVENDVDQDCYSTAQFNLVVLSEPTIGTPMNIEVCDDAPLDGSSDFDLTEQDIEVDPNGLGSVSYHASQGDAETGANPLSSPYTVTGTQTIYVRLTDSNGCSNTTQFDISVLDAPNIGQPQDLANICDENSSLDQNTFDLSVQDDAVLNGNDPANHIVNYYESQADAEADTNALGTNYSTPFQAGVTTGTLYARLENIQTGCFNVVAFTIIFERCEIIFPEGFSPNDDGVNDTFSIPGLAEQFPNFVLKIFNRNGSMIYETSANNYEEFAGIPNKGLLAGDGLVPVGVYFYTIEYNDPDEEDTASWVYINY